MQLVVRYVGDHIVHAYFPEAYNLWVSVANACHAAFNRKQLLEAGQSISGQVSDNPAEMSSSDDSDEERSCKIDFPEPMGEGPKFSDTPFQIVNMPVTIACGHGYDAILTGCVNLTPENVIEIDHSNTYNVRWTTGDSFAGKIRKIGFANRANYELIFGKLYNSNNEPVYYGQFLCGKYHGRGTLYRERCVFVGRFSRGHRQGFFKVFAADKSLWYTADFENDELISYTPAMTFDGTPLVVIKKTPCATNANTTEHEPNKKRQKLDDAAFDQGIDDLGLDAEIAESVKGVIQKATTSARNNDPERQLVRAVATEWETSGITCTGKERAEELTMQMADGSKRHLDMEIEKADLVGIVEFKADPKEFMHGVGQLVGYHRRMKLSGGKYAKAVIEKKASAFVVTPTMPDAFDVETASLMDPRIGAWWPGCGRGPI